MTEMYWITRLGNIHTLFVVILLVGAVCGIVALVNVGTGDFDEEDRGFKKLCRAALFMVGFSALGLTFIPSTKDMLIIYGIGGTVDYIKGNDTAKQLPDKCIEAIDKFLDEYTEKEDK